MQKFIIELSREQLDKVMKALGELPLKESYETFNVINEQFIQQTKSEEES